MVNRDGPATTGREEPADAIAILEAIEGGDMKKLDAIDQILSEELESEILRPHLDAIAEGRRPEPLNLLLLGLLLELRRFIGRRVRELAGLAW